MRLPNEQVLQHTRRYLELIGGRELFLERKAGLHRRDGRELREVLQPRVLSATGSRSPRPGSSPRSSGRGRARCCATSWAGNTSTAWAATASSARGSTTPRSCKAVTDQMQRMALNSQELLEPWRAALAQGAGRGDAGRAAELVLHQQRHRRHRRRHQADPALHPAATPSSPPSAGSTASRMGSLSLMGKASFREPFQGGLQDVRFVPYGDADALEDELGRCDAVGTQIAGVVLEPVQGEAGGVVPPDDYFPRARELCTEYGALLIADEIQTGMGRTGEAVGSGPLGRRARHHVPRQVDRRRRHAALGVHLQPHEIWEVMIPNPIIHSTTFGGNPLACAAGLAAIQVTLEEDLPGQAAAKGDFLLRELGCLQRKYPQVLAGGPRQGPAHRDGVPDPGDRLAGGGRPVQARGAGGGHLLQGAGHPDRAGAWAFPMELLQEMLNRLEDAFLEVSKAR